MTKKPAVPPTPLDGDAFLKGLERLATRLDTIEDDDESIVYADDVSEFVADYTRWADDPDNAAATWARLYDEYVGVFDMYKTATASVIIPALVAKEIVPAAHAPQHYDASLELLEPATNVLFGDTRVDGDLVFEGTLVVVGNLDVRGVIAGESHNARCRLIVAGDVRANAIDTYGDESWVCASGQITATEVLAAGEALFTLGAKTKAFFAGENLDDEELLLQARVRFAFDDLDDDDVFEDAREGRGDLAQFFRPELFTLSKETIAPYAFMQNVFAALRAGKPIWK